MKKIILLAFAISMIVTGCTTAKTESTMNKELDNTLDVNLTDVHGDTYNLTDYKGQKVVIKMWASWCPICLSGLEEYNELSETFDDAVVLSMVSPNVNNEMSREKFTTWFKSLPEYKNVTVFFDENGKLVKEFGVRAYPSFVFINEKGDVEKVTIGHQSNQQVIELLKALS